MSACNVGYGAAGTAPLSVAESIGVGAARCVLPFKFDGLRVPEPSTRAESDVQRKSGAGGFVQRNLTRKKLQSSGPRDFDDEVKGQMNLRDREGAGSMSGEDASGMVKIELDAGELSVLKRILESLEAKGLKEDHSPDSGSDKRVAQILFDARRDRARLFPVSMFSEPAWDMLLALYIADEVTVAGDLARWIRTPLTTAMRWIQYLESHKLVVRESSPADRRAHVIRLTDQARANMRVILSEMVEKFT